MITHLSETRLRSRHRTSTCRDIFLMSNPALVPADVLASLHMRDTALRKNALKSGHSHVIVVKPAKRGARGKQLHRAHAAHGAMRPLVRLRFKTKPANNATQFVFVPTPDRTAHVRTISAVVPSKRLWQKTQPCDVIASLHSTAFVFDQQPAASKAPSLVRPSTRLRVKTRLGADAAGRPGLDKRLRCV